MNKQKLSGISAKLLEVYVLWQSHTKHIPKMLRYSMAVRIDTIFAEIVELVYIAMFAPLDRRQFVVNKANTKNDLLKFMLNTLFELKGLKESTYIEISFKLEEIGRLLYGWKNQIEKQNQNGSVKTEPLGKDRK